MKHLITAVTLVLFLAIPAISIAVKPDDAGKCPTKKVKGVCTIPEPQPKSEFCPVGFIWLDLYEFCIKV